MNTSLQHLPRERQLHLKQAVEIIKTVVHPEKIILYGVFASKENFGLYSERDEHLKGSYDILVVTRKNEFRCDHSLQDIVENRSKHMTPVNVIVHDIDYVCKQLGEGQVFFYELRQSGILLFDAAGDGVPEGPRPNFIKIRETACVDFETWMHRGRVFYYLALHIQQNGDRPLALFALHQACEQTFQALLLGFNGYKPCTHNLDKLRRYTNRFSIGLSAIFPRNTPEEDQLFKLLLKGYVEGRYNADFTISESDMQTLTHRVHSLQQIAEHLFLNRLIFLGNLVTKYEAVAA